MSNELYVAVAKKNGVSVNEVENALQEAVQYINSNETLNKIPCTGSTPNPEEVIEYTIDRIFDLRCLNTIT